MDRILLYIERFANVVLFALPGQYRQRKLKILENLYRLSVSTIKKTGEPYWMEFGTLLGHYRTRAIIPHDKDIDFAMMESSYEVIKKIKKSDLPKGLRLFDSSKNHLGPKVYFTYKGFDFDIFFYRDEGDTIINFVEGKYPNERQHIPKNIIFPIKKDVFLGEEIFVPNKTEEYLKLIYGYLGTGGWRDQKTGLWHPPKK